jgi:integrase
MGRPRNPVPAYRHHRRSGKAGVDVYDAKGRKTSVTLPGLFGSEESKAEYQRLLNLLQECGGRLPAKHIARQTGDTTISELILRFFDEKVAIDYVNAHGKPTTEQSCFRQALKPLGRLFGPTIVREFDAAALESVRQSMITGSWMNADERKLLEKQRKPVGWSRGNINKCISRLRSMFRWAVLKKLIPASVVTDLECLPPLKPGRGGTRESKPVFPVAVEVVEATLPHLPPVVRDMVRFQLWTGCRPGEMCAMRSGDIDRSGTVWLYTPRSHKTAHRGHVRTIAIGPKSQLILRQYFKPDAGEDFMFSPAEQAEIIKAVKRALRKSKVQPSQVDRRMPNAKRVPGNSFDVRGYNHAIRRACKKAGVEHWHAHRLRHTAALLIEREYGAEAARAVLGLKTLNMTLHYSGIDAKRASEIAAKVG